MIFEYVIFSFVCFTCLHTDSVLVCTAPPGSGKNLNIAVQTGGASSEPVPLVSYASPALSRVRGCSDQAASSTTSSCGRLGGTLMTLAGSNFGASGAQVLVDGVLCGNVTHSPTSPHTLVTFALPPGVKAAASVLLLQQAGPISNALLVGYAQCPQGLYQNSTEDYACSVCQPGRYSGVEGSLTCFPCPSGSAGPSSGLSACVACTPGYYGASDGDATTGPTQCTPCSPGTYAVSSNQGSCLKCPPGTRASGNATQSCESCPAGSYQHLTGRLLRLRLECFR